MNVPFTGRVPSGSTRLKRRQLRRLGWCMCAIAHWQWDARRSEQQHLEYLQRALTQAVRERVCVEEMIENAAPGE